VVVYSPVGLREIEIEGPVCGDDMICRGYEGEGWVGCLDGLRVSHFTATTSSSDRASNNRKSTRRRVNSSLVTKR
jgi:hypothetical protein